MPDYKSYVIEKVSSEDFYKARFGRAFNPKVKTNVSCVFHNDDTPSLSINLDNGGAKCFASSCGKSIGNIVHFESEACNISEEIAARRLYQEFVRPIVSSLTIKKFSATLSKDQKLQSTFTRSTGINVATLQKFQIGYDVRSRRYTFPIPNQFGDTVNVRFYRPKSLRRKDDVKIYSLVENKGKVGEKRYGGIELFPWSFIKTYSAAKPLFFMASEKETMLAVEIGLQALCSTGGEGSWKEEWSDIFLGMDVGVVFDPDTGGESAASKIVATLQSVVNKVEKITLPFDESHKGDRDFDDWILSKSGTAFKLLQLFESAEQRRGNTNQKLSPSSPSEIPISELQLPRLYNDQVYDIDKVRSTMEMMNLCVKTRGIIAAVASRSYDIPWKFKIKTKNGNIDHTLSINRDLVSLVGATDSQVLETLSNDSGTKVKECRYLNWISVSEVEIIPLVDVGSDIEGRYTVQRCFVIGKHIDSNVPYELTVIPTTLSKTQEKIFIIVSAIEVSRAIDTWKFTENEWQEFETFKPDEDQSVTEKLHQLAKELSVNHTKIYSRPDWHTVALLTWFCPIGWYFPGEPELQRGWINALAVGDTQTGKSKVIQVFQRLLRLGDIVNAENCTFVGLVGGAIKTSSGQMMLRWGKIPLCDRKLVIVEELSGMSVEDISHMSEVRSRGVARLDKGGLSSQTPARTRLIALSNVRPMNKTLAQYLSGVKALQDLIGHAEDISRFDLIITLVDSEVSSDTINSPSDESTPATFTPDQLQKLCQFVWALKPTQIQFTDDAYNACLEQTKRLQKIYHPSVPIFKAASGRLLLARISAAIATLQFSWDGERISIEEEHVEAAVDLLCNLYNKPSFGYLEYSRQMQDREVIKGLDEIEQSIKRTLKEVNLIATFDSMLHAAKFSRDELAATGSMQLFQADDLLGALLRGRVIRKGEANTWEITQAGKTWMLQRMKHERKSRL